MVANYKYSGKKIILTGIAAAVAAGALTRESGFIGIPEVNGAVGTTVAFNIEGVFGLTFDAYASGQPAAGSILYWDTTADALSVGAANDDFPAVKVVTPVSATDGSFEGLLLPQTRPYGQEQA